MLKRLPNAVIRRARLKRARLKNKFHGVIDRTYFKETAAVTGRKTKIRFHCAAWGEFLNSFFGYTLPSLLQDGNVPTLSKEGYDLELDIYAHPNEYHSIIQQHSPCLDLAQKYMPINLIPLDGLKAGAWRGYYWRSALYDQIKRCIDEDSMTFFAGPDTIFGNWSVSNAVKMVQGKNVCLAAAHPRVSDSILDTNALLRLKSMERVIENDELVDLAFQHGQPSLSEFFDNKDANMTHAGISIREINDGTYSVIHNVPSPHLANFTKDDLSFFVGSGAPLVEAWPRLLLRQNRLKVVGSSDLFFSVELSTIERSNPRLQPGLFNNDKHNTRNQRYLQQYVFNSFCCLWRGQGNATQNSTHAKSP